MSETSRKAKGVVRFPSNPTRSVIHPKRVRPLRKGLQSCKHLSIKDTSYRRFDDDYERTDNMKKGECACNHLLYLEAIQSGVHRTAGEPLPPPPPPASPQPSLHPKRNFPPDGFSGALSSKQRRLFTPLFGLFLNRVIFTSIFTSSWKIPRAEIVATATSRAYSTRSRLVSYLWDVLHAHDEITSFSEIAMVPGVKHLPRLAKRIDVRRANG